MYMVWITSVIDNMKLVNSIKIIEPTSAFISIKNDMLFYHLFQFSYLAVIYAYLGTFVLLYHIVGAISLFGNHQLYRTLRLTNEKNFPQVATNATPSSPHGIQTTTLENCFV